MTKHILLPADVKQGMETDLRLNREPMESPYYATMAAVKRRLKLSAIVPK